MKLENKKTDIPKTRVNADGKTELSGEFMHYADLIALVIDGPTREKGVTIADIKENVSILDKCETANGDVMEFNAKQTQRIRDMCSEHRWGANSKDVILFDDDIRAADEGD